MMHTLVSCHLQNNLSLGLSLAWINVAIGTSMLLNHQARLEFSLYYQYGLGKNSVEHMKASNFGLRTAYWFTLR